MATADSTVAALTTLDPERRDAIIKAAQKINIMADALVSHADCAEAGEFEDVETAMAIVSSVARRQSVLAGLIVHSLNGIDETSAAELASEVRNG